MTDHGPQRQPASDPYNSPEWRAKFRQDCNQIAAEAKQEHDELARLRAENEMMREAILCFWDNKCCEYAGPGWCKITVPDEYVDNLKLAADALRGETK